MNRHDHRPLLDDGEYRLSAHPEAARETAGGILERRCLKTPATPGGLAVVGRFFPQPDGTWCAQITAAADVAAGGLSVVAAGVEHMNAIVALWHARRDAYLAQHCL